MPPFSRTYDLDLSRSYVVFNMSSTVDLKYLSPTSFEDLKTVCNSDYFSHKSLGFKKYEHAYIVPADFSTTHYHRGVVTQDHQVVSNSLLFEGFEPDWANLVNYNDAKLCHKTVVYIGFLEPIWGHILTDDLSKLWFLKSNWCQDILNAGGNLTAIIPWHSKTLEDFFRLAGCNLECVENVKCVTQYDNIIIPDNSFYTEPDGTRKFTKEYEEIVHYITSQIPIQQSSGKLYFSRSEFSKKTRLWDRREYGEKVIENAFAQLGYRIVYPEENLMLENLKLIRNCEAFASTEGSISHNVLFCPKNTHVTILRKVNYTNRWQLIINQVAGVNVTYVDAHHSIISHGVLGPFYMGVTKYLESFAGHKIFHFPYWMKLSFWWYLVQNRRIVKRILKIFRLI